MSDRIATEDFATAEAAAVDKTDVGLGSVDNTADSAKPVSTAQQTALNLKANIASPTFTGTVGGVTKTHVGLGNVDNVADASKPVSTAQQTALDLKAPLASPTFTGTVAGITKTHVGLGNADNTSDANKPVSTATQTALDLKAPIASPTFTGTVAGVTKGHVGLGSVDNTTDAGKPVSTAQQTALDLKANIASPTFTGTVTIPTGGSITAPTGLVKGDVGLGNVTNTSDASKPVSTAQQTALDLKAPLASPAFTGTPTGITKTHVGLGNVENTTLLTATAWAAKGDLAVGTANDTAAVLGVGTFGQTQVADSATATGLIYTNPVDLRDTWSSPNTATPSYETIPRTTFISNQAIPATGIVALQAIVLPKNLVVHRIAFVSATTPANGPTHWWFSLCDNTYTTLRSTADQTNTAWGASTLQRIAISSNFTTTYDGVYYLAIMMTSSSAQVSLAGVTQLAGLQGLTPLLGVTGDGSKTTAPADGTLLAAAPASKTQTFYAYVD